ncbi:hypothetical protein B0T10DRAFT_532380 [Thelonectria olida]|uniref:C2H2-type domain-containing protein n=1 Tax=Thelonectria olida TaxID=1576542 RepID=A0A9P9AKH9_9HYPO|nr:hypothetical protein B0T10DRAFT_532380 [Thelonectria olida]
MDLTPPSLTASPVPPHQRSFKLPPALPQTPCPLNGPGAGYPSPSRLSPPLPVLASANSLSTRLMPQRFSEPDPLLPPSAAMSHPAWVTPDQMVAPPVSGPSSSTVPHMLPPEYDSFPPYDAGIPASFGAHDSYLPPPNHSYSHPPPPSTSGPSRAPPPPIPPRPPYGYLHDPSAQRVRMEGSSSYYPAFERHPYPASVPTSTPYSSEGSPFATNLPPGLGDASIPQWPKQDYDASPEYGNPQASGSDLGGDRRASKNNRTRRPARKHTTKEEANFQCEVKGCGKFFSRSYNYKSHLETHDEKREYPFPCPIDGCTKKFVRKTDLQRHHQSVHMKERNHKCDYCGRLFARKDTLRRHMEDGCSKRFDIGTLNLQEEGFGALDMLNRPDRSSHGSRHGG